MIETLLHTDADHIYTLLRIIAGIVIFPYGMQKLFGWFDGVGIKGTLEQMAVMRVPKSVAWLVIFTGALIVHLPDGWAMNWFGKKNGEGIEYHVILLSLLLTVIVKGSGAISIDLLMTP